MKDHRTLQRGPCRSQPRTQDRQLRDLQQSRKGGAPACQAATPGTSNLSPFTPTTGVIFQNPGQLRGRKKRGNTSVCPLSLRFPFISSSVVPCETAVWGTGAPRISANAGAGTQLQEWAQSPTLAGQLRALPHRRCCLLGPLSSQVPQGSNPEDGRPVAPWTSGCSSLCLDFLGWKTG